jgi:hypothetical protein
MTDSTAATPTRRAHRADPIEVVGLAVVTTAAVVLSFSALAGLGLLVGFGTAVVFGWDFPLSLLVPLCIDAYGATAARIAVNRAYSDETRRQAMIHGVVAIVVGILGNAAYHLLEARVVHLGDSMWVLVIAVSIVPPVALGALVHLMSLCAADRRAAEEAGEVPVPAAVPTPVPVEVRELDDVPAQVRTEVHVPTDAPEPGDRPLQPGSAAAEQLLGDLGLPVDEPAPYPSRHGQTPGQVRAPDDAPAEPVRWSDRNLPPVDAPAPNPLVLKAIETFAPDGRLEKVPPLRDIKSALRVGQPKATQVKEYLAELTAS